MKSLKAIWMVAGVALGLSSGICPGENALPPLVLLARYHFAGSAQLAADTNAAKLKEVWELPASRIVRNDALQKLARAPRQIFQHCLDTTAGDGAAQILPLLEDLLSAESCGEIRGQANQPAEWVLAIRLNEERAQVWNANLRQITQLWKAGAPVDYAADGIKGWEVRRQNPAGLLRFVRADSWCVLGLGTGPLRAFGEVVGQVRRNELQPATGAPGWLSAWINLPGLTQWHGPFSFLRLWTPSVLPEAGLSLSSQGGYLRSRWTFHYAARQSWSLEPWRIPTQTIREPLISFTAIQGMGASAARCQVLQSLEIDPPPNQLYLWAQSLVPFQTFAAIPVPRATNLIERLAGRLPSLLSTNLTQLHLGTIRAQTNRAELLWTGLPFIAPYLRPVRESNGEFIQAGLFPGFIGTNSAPAELFAQVLNRTNLLYYDWEITQERLTQDRILFELGDVVAMQPRPGVPPVRQRNDLRAQPWLMALAPYLGNSVTEITVVSAHDLLLERKSHIGFTGLELVLLARWLDDPRFPWLSPNWPLRPLQAVGKRPPTP